MSDVDRVIYTPAQAAHGIEAKYTYKDFEHGDLVMVWTRRLGSGSSHWRMTQKGHGYIKVIAKVCEDTLTGGKVLRLLSSEKKYWEKPRGSERFHQAVDYLNLNFSNVISPK